MMTALSSRHAELLARMRADNAGAAPVFRPSAMWAELVRRFDAILEAEGVGEVEEQEFNTLFFQSLPTNPRYYRYALWLFYKELRARDSRGLLRSILPSSGRKTGHWFDFEGCAVTWDKLASIDALYSIAEAEPGLFEAPVVFGDLGAGWGRLGYYLKKANPRATYVVFDLPEPLLLSSSRLTTLLGQERVVDYAAAAAMPSIGRQALCRPGLWFCGPQHLERVEAGAFDVFVNLSSFQEMTPEQVTAYLGLIDRATRGSFYTQQYWKHEKLKARYGTVGGVEDYAFPAAWSRLYLRNTGFSERYFEAAFRTRP